MKAIAKLMLVFMGALYGLQALALTVEDLRVQTVKNPEGIDDVPKFSWKLNSTDRNVMQVSYRIAVYTDAAGKHELWNSGVISSSQSVAVPAVNLQLQPGTRYYWRVTVRDNKGKEAVSALRNYFVTGLLSSGWSGAKWLKVSDTDSVKLVADKDESGAPMFRRLFAVRKTLKDAKLYTAALGVYDLFVNGRRVGHLQPDGSVVYEELKPGWTDYRHRVFYSTHDVTWLMQKGNNVIGAVVAEGWWTGGIAHGMYGTIGDLGFIAKLVMTYTDGSQETLVTDRDWKWSKDGALRYSDIYNGEIYDARLERAWFTPKYNASAWKPVIENQAFKGKIEAFKGPYVQVLHKLLHQPKTSTVYKGVRKTGTDYGMIDVQRQQNGPATIVLHKGETVVYDFGQNIVGWMNFKVKGKQGTRLSIRCSEMLNDDGRKDRGNDGPGGSLYLKNLRQARAEVYYTLSGARQGEAWHPSTTFYGFRYCTVTATDDVTLLWMEAQPVSSSTEDTGAIATNSVLANQLFSNVVWGQRGNLLSIPTDCPQRDERQGWTADTQVFSTTGMYNANMETFYRKWMIDMQDGQQPDGAFPDTAPVGHYGIGGSGWSDAGIIVPWYIYRMYGDKDVLRENYSAMEKYMDWMTRLTGDGEYQGAHTTYGDWLSFVPTDSRYISMAYYAYDAQLMAKMSQALSASSNDAFAQKAKKYDELFRNIRTAFLKRYFPDGQPTQTSQTAQLMALAYDLVTDSAQVADMVRMLEGNITGNAERLNTGFLGTAILNPTLSRFGLSDKAYNLLLQKANPSWLYPIMQGATTMWERWNSYTKDRGFGDPGMNSFNHYAYGSIGEWMYRYMSGIEVDEQQPGFKHFILQPTPDTRKRIPSYEERITQVDGSYNSAYGRIESNWKTDGVSDFDYTCTVPANTTATLYLPANASTAAEYAVGRGYTPAEGITFVGYRHGRIEIALGSGTYRFKTKL